MGTPWPRRVVHRLCPRVFPQNLQMPTTSSSDAAIFAARDLIHALQHPTPAAPFAQLGTEQAQALHQLATILECALHPTTSHDPAPPTTSYPRVDRPSPRVNISSPRVASPPPKTTEPPSTPRVMPTAPVRVQDTLPHQYPTRSRTLHTANHVATITNKIHTLVAPDLEQHLPKHFAYAVVDPDTGKSLEYNHLIKQEKTKEKWTRSFATST